MKSFMTFVIELKCANRILTARKVRTSRHLHAYVHDVLNAILLMGTNRPEALRILYPSG